MHVAMRDDLWAPFNVQPLVLIANVRRELTGAKSEEKVFNLFAANAPPRSPPPPLALCLPQIIFRVQIFQIARIKFGLCNALLIAEPINADSQLGLSSPAVVNCLAKEHDTRGDRGITCSIFRVYVHEYWQDISVHVSLTHARTHSHSHMHAHTHSNKVIIIHVSSTEHIYKMGCRAENTG